MQMHREGNENLDFTYYWTQILTKKNFIPDREGWFRKVETGECSAENFCKRFGITTIRSLFESRSIALSAQVL